MSTIETEFDAPVVPVAPGEEWWGIPGWPEYEITRHGDVRRVKPGHGAQVGHELKHWPHKFGYPSVTLYSKNRGTSIPIHRLLAITFLPAPRPGQTHVAHWDGKTSNISLSNLRWATPLENHLDKRRHGTDSFGERNPMARLTEGDVREIRAAVRMGETRKNVAGRFGVVRQTVDSIINGSSWGHVA